MGRLAEGADNPIAGAEELIQTFALTLAYAEKCRANCCDGFEFFSEIGGAIFGLSARLKTQVRKSGWISAFRCICR